MVIERNEEAYRLEILRQAEAEIEAQKKDFDMKKIDDTLAAELNESIESDSYKTPVMDTPESANPMSAVRRTRSQVEVPIDLWKLDSDSPLRNSQGHYW